MDADAWKILIGAIAVVVSGLGGQFLAGRNARITADATHANESSRWARDLKYTTYLDLVAQFEAAYRMIRRWQRTGEVRDSLEAWNSLNGITVPAIRLVAPQSVRDEANALDVSFRNWCRAVKQDMAKEEKDALGDRALADFKGFVGSIRDDLGLHGIGAKD
jgi:hypothetical protein